MEKPKDVTLFSQDKRAISRFFVTLAFLAAGLVAGEYIFSLIDKQAMLWTSTIITVLMVTIPVTLSFFLSRWLAFKVKFLPKTKNRDAVMGVSFFVISAILISFLLALI